MEQRPAIETLSFETALDELESIVRMLESGQAALDESISTYERGVALKKHCEKKLSEARMKVEKIAISPHGEVDHVPFDEK